MGRYLLTRDPIHRDPAGYLGGRLCDGARDRRPGHLVGLYKATAQDIALLRQQLGLDQSVPVQYWVFITNAVRGNLGRSLADKGDVAH